MVKNLPANAGDAGDTGSVPGVGNGNPLQYSCLENPMDRGAWPSTVHGVSKSQTQLSTQHTHTQVTVTLFLSKHKTLCTFYNNLPEHKLTGALLGRGFSWKPQICLLAPRGMQPSVFVNQLHYLQWCLPFQCLLLLLLLIHYPPGLGLVSSVISMTPPTAPATAAKSLQSCLTLCDPIPGILQARTLEWVAISFSNA